MGGVFFRKYLYLSVFGLALFFSSALSAETTLLPEATGLPAEGVGETRQDLNEENSNSSENLKKDLLINRLLVGLRFLMVSGVVTSSFMIQFDAPVAAALVPGALAGAMSAGIQHYNVQFNEWLNRKGILSTRDAAEGSPHEKVIKYYTTALAYILIVQLSSTIPGVEMRDLSVSFFTHAALTAALTLGQGFWDIWNATKMDRALQLASTAKQKSWIAVKSGITALVISAVATAGDAFAAFGEVGAFAFLGALGFSGWFIYEKQYVGPAHRCLIHVRDKLKENQFEWTQIFRQSPVTTCRQMLKAFNRPTAH